MCERYYTPAVVAEMQNVSLAVELRRRIVRYRHLLEPFASYDAAMQRTSLDMFEMWLSELAPDYSQCDNPPERNGI